MRGYGSFRLDFVANETLYQLSYDPIQLTKKQLTALPEPQLFIERNLLCAVQESRQVDSSKRAHHRCADGVGGESPIMIPGVAFMGLNSPFPND